MRFILIFITFFGVSMSVQAQNFANAKFGGDFLSVGAGARALAMGSAHAAIANDVTAAYWNPAGLVHIEKLDIAYMHSERFSGIVSYDYGAVALPLEDKNSVIALSVFRQGVDNIKNTLNAFDRERNLPRENPEDFIEEFSVTDLAFFFSYAKKLNQKLSWGVNAKVVNQRLGPFADAWGYSLDAGVQLQTKKIFLAANVIDLTTMLKFWSVNSSEFGDFEETFGDDIPSGRNEKVLPTVKLGAGRFFRLDDFSMIAAADVDMRFENRKAFFINAGRISFEPHIGIEGTYKERVSLRTGLTDFNTDPDGNLFLSPTLGAGLNFQKIFVDYGFTNFSGSSSVLGLTHRISLRISI